MDENSNIEINSEEAEALPKEHRRIYTYMGWLTTLLVPVFLVLSAVRLVMTPALINFEYNQSSFPSDPYGFTREDRIYWSRIALDYLLNPDDISFLADLEFEDGSAVYNSRELRHMLDVKNTVNSALSIWYISMAVLICLAGWSWHSKMWRNYSTGLSRGGLLTMILIGSIILFVLISFGVLFVAFHNVFFQPGTWTFRFSDTLIRLFPQKFWRDVFLIVGGFSFGGGLLLWLGFRRRNSSIQSNQEVV